MIVVPEVSASKVRSHFHSDFKFFLRSSISFRTFHVPVWSACEIHVAILPIGHANNCPALRGASQMRVSSLSPKTDFVFDAYTLVIILARPGERPLDAVLFLISLPSFLRVFSSLCIILYNTMATDSSITESKLKISREKKAIADAAFKAGNMTDGSCSLFDSHQCAPHRSHRGVALRAYHEVRFS